MKWYLCRHMYIIWTYFFFSYIHTFSPTQFSQYFPNCFPFFVIKYFCSILWRKYNMIFAIAFCTSQTMSICNMHISPFYYFLQLADRNSMIVQRSFYFYLNARRLFWTTRLTRGFLYTKKADKIFFTGFLTALYKNRTCDLSVRSRTLYPLS